MKHRKHRHIPRILFFILLIGILSFFVDGIIVDANAIIHFPAADAFFNWMTNLANIFVLLIIVTTLFLIEEKKREWIIPLWISFFGAAFIAVILKIIIARPRPMGELTYLFTGYVSHSFPSLHAMVAFSVVPLLRKEFPRLTAVWFVIAFLVALSRIYLNVHYFSDVVWGMILGYLIGVGIVYIEEKYKICRVFQ